MWVAGADRAVGMAKVDFDKDTPFACLSCKVIIGLVHELAWSACGTREKDDGAAVLCQIKQAVYVFQRRDVIDPASVPFQFTSHSVWR